MTWNWQLPQWPKFTWNSRDLEKAEALFLARSGVMVGTTSYLDEGMQNELKIELLSFDALDSSKIEGEILDRESVQSSIKRQLGLGKHSRNVLPSEEGISEMMIDLCATFKAPLTHKTLYSWHEMLMRGNRRIDCIGHYRQHIEAMQIVSGVEYDSKIYFEAPPSAEVKKHMDLFLAWYKTEGKKLPAITQAGIAHVWFESVHPFEDGNGRLGRAISEKLLAQATATPVFTALAPTLLKRRREYYAALQGINKTLDLSDWLLWFASAALEAQQRCQASVEFIIDKSKMLNALKGQLNLRQEKALLRMFKQGPEGFKGGMSASKYMAITGAPIATTTRDLTNLVSKGALTRTGQLKSTRYHLSVQPRPVKSITVDQIKSL